MVKWYDSHIHLNYLGNEDWKLEKDWVFNNVSIKVGDLEMMERISGECENVYMTVGVHPLEIDDSDLQNAAETMERFISRNRSRVIAIGETGLDFYRVHKNEVTQSRQEMWFYVHCDLARKFDLPLVLHVRNAHMEMIEMLASVPDMRGVVHCYESNAEILEKYLRLQGDWMFSVSPLVLRAESLFRHYLHKMDIGRLLVETDSPYLAKDHLKVMDLVRVIAEEKEMDVEECRVALWENFCRVFGLEI